MQRRKIIVSLTGPWGTNKVFTYIKAGIEFPPAYPEVVAPSVSLEKNAALGDDIVANIIFAIAAITASYLSLQRSSLEAILRYLLGEQTLEESLSVLRKRQQSVDLDSTLEVESSSSEEDDETLAKEVGLKIDDMESSDPMITGSRIQDNPPLPKACGAMWADNGRLVCFFPHKQEKEPSFLDLTLKSGERISKSRSSILEGFGRFHHASSRKKPAASTLETIESGASDSEESFSSSSDSSSASGDMGLPRHHFLPSMTWRGESFVAFPGSALDESQKSSSGMEKSKLTTSKGRNFISIHDFNDLLPAKEDLARKYVFGNPSRDCLYNAEVARDLGLEDLANTWLLIDLILQDKVPLEFMTSKGNSDQDLHKPAQDPILIIARHAASRAKPKEKSLCLLSEERQEEHSLAARAAIKWGHHPFARRYLVDAL